MKESAPAHTYPEKIFLSRSHFSKAIEAEGGLELLDSFFENNGFTVVYPEEHSLSQMIRIVHNAKICASESGTITFNTLFGNKNQHVIVIERSAIFALGNLITNLSRAKLITYIDGHHTIYPSNVGGPCILGLTDEFERFINDNHYQLPSPAYLDPSYKKDCFEKFEKSYSDKNTYGIFLKDSKSDWLPVIYEAFSASIEQFPWLDKKAIIEKYYQDANFQH